MDELKENMAYSNDLRLKIVEIYEKKEDSIRGLAQRFNVDKDTVHRYVKQYQETGTVDKKPHGGGRQPKLSEHDGYNKLIELYEEDNTRTDKEYAQLLYERFGIQVSRRIVNRAFAKLNITKKITYHASEQLCENVQEKAIEYIDEIKVIEREKLVFVDEAAAHSHLVRTYGRAPKGQRAYGRKPNDRGKRISMLGALALDGLRTGMFWEGYVDAQAFQIFVDDDLIPHLKSGDIVVWDNYSVHKRIDFERKINAAGAFVMFLPPYSPELSPIKHCWSKIKSIMRGRAARCADGLWDAFCVGFDAVTPEDAEDWFKHCGYCR